LINFEKEAVMVMFEVLSRHSSTGTNQNWENFCFNSQHLDKYCKTSFPNKICRNNNM